MGLLAKSNSYFWLFASLFAFIIVTVESSQNDCDLKSDYKVINISKSDDGFAYLNVLNLNEDIKNLKSNSCDWNILSVNQNSWLDLSNIILAPSDKVTIVGYYPPNNSSTIFTGTGAIVSGLISTSNFQNVSLSIEFDLKNTFDRIFSTVYYWDSQSIQLTKDSGSLGFPLNRNTDLKINNKFGLSPSADFFGQSILLNFTQLPKIYSFTLDGKQYSEKSPPSALFLHPHNAKTPMEIEFKNYTPVDGEAILIHYMLVSTDCSFDANLKLAESKPIAVPSKASFTAQRCAQHFHTDAKEAQFQLLIDPATGKLPNPGDSINVYSADGHLQIGLNDPAIMYFKGIDNILDGTDFLVIYDSPYFASAADSKFIAPQMKVISLNQARIFALTKEAQVTLNGEAGKVTEITHVIYPAQFSNSTHVLVDFGSAKIPPGKLVIKIYDSESIDAGKLIVTLGEFDQLPSVIPGRSGVMRIVYTGIISNLKVTYRLVDSSTSCQFISSYSSTFEVRGGQSDLPCSWYIPPAQTAYSVIDPTVVKIPAGKTLTVNTFSNAGSNTQKFSGPIKEFFYPDIFLNGSFAYEFMIDSSKLGREDLHLLIANKPGYLNGTLVLQSEEKISSIKSVNYPGNYPIGLTQSWTLNGDNKKFALVTLDAVQLGADHSLLLNAKGINRLWTKNDANLVNTTDFLLPFPIVFTLNASSRVMSNRGFNFDIQYPGVAEEVTLAKDKDDSKQIFFNSTTGIAANPLNVWRVTVGDLSPPFSAHILHINVTLADDIGKTKAALKIFDSISVRHANAHQANGSIVGTGGHFVGSIKSAIIMYDYSASFATKTNFSINIVISSEKCGNSKNYTTKCHTADRCITDMMICNGIDECGDYTDELYCDNNHPPPPPSPSHGSSGGVNTLVVIFLLMPLSAALGIAGYIYLPQMLLRWRRGRYSEFRDLSEVS